MTIETWIAYVIAATVIIVIPGPTVMLVISQSVRFGYRAAIPLVAGVMLGDLMAMSVSLAGLGLLLKASATLFTAIKIAGAVYLFYLGLKMWLAEPMALESVSPEAHPWKQHLIDAFVVTVLNPKAMVFFLAFIPQFLNASSPVPQQMIVFGVTFLAIATISAACYALFSARLGTLIQNEKSQRWFQRAGGSVLLGAGVVMASMRQS